MQVSRETIREAPAPRASAFKVRHSPGTFPWLIHLRGETQNNATDATNISASAPALETSTHGHRYPNPGYLGSSSHAAIFEHLPAQSGVANHSPLSEQSALSIPDVNSNAVAEGMIERGALVIGEIISQLDIHACKALVMFWLGKGTNLALGGTLVLDCIESTAKLLSSVPDDYESPAELARRLLGNTFSARDTLHSASVAEFSSHVCGRDTKWEALIVSLVAMGRATVDVPFFPPLFSTNLELLELQKQFTHLSDSCMEIGLQLDCLGDALLICQYENWILHSIIDGDQSKSLGPIW